MIRRIARTWCAIVMVAALCVAGATPPAQAQTQRQLDALDITTTLGFVPLSAAPVTSVAGRTGAVTISVGDICGGSIAVPVICAGTSGWQAH